MSISRVSSFARNNTLEQQIEIYKNYCRLLGINCKDAKSLNKFLDFVIITEEGY